MQLQYQWSVFEPYWYQIFTVGELACNRIVTWSDTESIIINYNTHTNKLNYTVEPVYSGHPWTQPVGCYTEVVCLYRGRSRGGGPGGPDPPFFVKHVWLVAIV